MLRDLIEPTNLARIAAFTVLSLIGVLPAMLALGALSNLWADYKDSTDATYLLVGGMALVVASVPAFLAVRVIRRAPEIIIASALVVAAIAVTGLVTYVQAQGHSNATRHIEERRRDDSVPPSLNNLQITPVATVSVGAPR